jgi:hypothetical protein
MGFVGLPSNPIHASSLSHPGSLDCLVTGLPKDHLPHLITDLLPIVNEITGLLSAHHFRSFVLENADYGFGLRTLLCTLATERNSAATRSNSELTWRLMCFAHAT